MITFKNIVDVFNDIADKHYQIKAFQTGELSEVDPSKLDQQDFPLLFLQPSSVSIEERTLTYTVNLFIMTQVLDDETGIDDAYSQTLLMMQDIVSEFRQVLSSSSFITAADKNEYIIELPVNCEPFTERFANLLTGWEASFSIQVNNQNNLCIAPIDNS